MPAMQGMPTLEELAHPEGIPGEYGVHPLFAHGGEYRLRLTIKPLADAEFVVTFLLNVADASAAKNRKPKPKPYTMDLKTSPKSPKAGDSVSTHSPVAVKLADISTPLTLNSASYSPLFSLSKSTFLTFGNLAAKALVTATGAF